MNDELLHELLRGHARMEAQMEGLMTRFAAQEAGLVKIDERTRLLENRGAVAGAVGGAFAALAIGASIEWLKSRIAG